jgi:hypothetical protein
MAVASTNSRNIGPFPSWSTESILRVVQAVDGGADA